MKHTFTLRVHDMDLWDGEYWWAMAPHVDLVVDYDARGFAVEHIKIIGQTDSGREAIVDECSASDKPTQFHATVKHFASWVCESLRAEHERLTAERIDPREIPYTPIRINSRVG